MMETADKELLRRGMVVAREGLLPADRARWSSEIGRRVLGLREVAAAESVFCYVGIGSEVSPRELLDALLRMGKRVAAPRICTGRRMEARQIAGLSELSPGCLGIPEPAASAPLLDAAAVAMVPGLAFSEAGGRLGRGGGYYDRYLAEHPGTLPIGLAFEAQVVGELPTEGHDVAMAMVVTERRVIRVS